jgi:hypothetical protein
MRACIEHVYLEVEIEEEGAFPLYFQGESRCDLGNLNIAPWFLNSILVEFLVSIAVCLVETEYCYKLNRRCRHEMDDCGHLIQG